VTPVPLVGIKRSAYIKLNVAIMAKIRGKRIYGTDVLPCTGARVRDLVFIHAACRNSWLVAVAWVAWVSLASHAYMPNNRKPTEYQVKAALPLQFRQVSSNCRRLDLPLGKGDSFPRLCARPGSFRLDSRFNSLAGGSA